VRRHNARARTHLVRGGFGARAIVGERFHGALECRQLGLYTHTRAHRVSECERDRARHLQTLYVGWTQ
jgi:hypothetical protein